MNRVILSAILAVLPLTGLASPVKDWFAAREGLCLNDAGGTLSVEVLGERTWHAEQRFVSPVDEAIFGLGQFHEGIMDFKDHFMRLKQFNTVIALPFCFSPKGYGLFWNNASLTEWNPEKIELEHQIQASWDYEWALFEPEEDGEYTFIVDGLGRNASLYVDIDELCMEDGFEKRTSRRIINQDYNVIPSCLAGRVMLEKGKTYELNIKADFKNLYVRTPSMSGKSTYPYHRQTFRLFPRNAEREEIPCQPCRRREGCGNGSRCRLRPGIGI